MKLARTALAAIVIALAVTGAAAQSGGLTVLVVDANGPLPGATVTISHETGYVKTTSMLTNAKGVAEFPVLRPGRGYIVEVSFPGYSARRQENIQIRISETTPLTIQLAAEIVERVQVVADSEVVDLEKTSPSSKFSDEFIQDLPVPGRFYQNVLTLAPGVQDSDGDGNPNVHGSRDRDFKTEVSGVSNVDPLTGGYMSLVNPNSIEEMEVITAGAGVEFSRAQGGFARIIQKQGSNEFEGVFEFYWRSSTLDGTGAEDTSALPEQQFDWYQPSIQVSGPIVKDKLWYRLSHEIIDQEIPVNTVGTLAIQKREQGIHADQLTWQVSPRNKLAFQYQADPMTWDNFGVSSLRAPNSALGIERGSTTYTLSWTAPYSPKILVDSKIAWQDLNTARFPSTYGIPNECVQGISFLEDAQCFNLETSQVSGSYFLTIDDHSQRFTARSDATIYGGRFWGMQHQFKAGMIVENERYFRYMERNPDVQFFVYYPFTDDASGGGETPEPQAIIISRFAVPETANVTATGTTWGIYGQDQIQPRQNLTMTLGLRIDREEINAEGRDPVYPESEFDEFTQLTTEGNLSARAAMPQAFTAYEAIDDFVAQLAQTLGLPEVTVKQSLSSAAQQSYFWEEKRRARSQNVTNTNLSPFFALSWDPWSNGKTKFAVTARRYHDKIFLNIPLIELEPATTTIWWNAAPSSAGYWNITGTRSSVNPAVNISTVDRDLETPYQDEFTFQFERELWSETSFRYSYINRAYRNQFQDYDLNHAPEDLGRCRWATTGDNTTVEPVVIGDPDYNPELAPGDGIIDDCAGKIEVPRGQGSGNDQPDPFANANRLERPDGIPDLYVQNPGWGTMYWVSNVNKIDYQAHVFELIRRQYRSWEMQASYVWSEAKGDGEDFNQALGDDRTTLEDEKGYQSYDQRHVVKVNATTITPWGFRLGGAITWQSGRPYSIVTQAASFDAVPPSFLGLGGGTSRVRQTYDTGQRNDQRNTSWWNLDLKFTKEFNVGRGLNMQVSAEVFNVLNDGTYQIYDQVTDSGLRVNGTNFAIRRFGRQWQLGLKMAF
jgi:outer membrane receptor protein involved in Fe transport